MQVEKGPVLCVCKDPGGTNGLLPVYKKLVAMGVDAVLIANGKAVELLTNSKEQLNFLTFNSVEEVLAEFPNPSILVTSMCSSDGGINLGKDLIPLLRGVCPTVALNDYWGGSLSEKIWGPPSNRPDYIVVNDKIGAECVRKSWCYDDSKILQLGYPALDEFVNFDKTKLRAEAAQELGIEEEEKMVFFCGGGTHTGKEMMSVVSALNIVENVRGIPFTLVPREHPRMRNNFLDEVEEWDRALDYYSAGKLVTGPKVAKIRIDQLLARADLVIQDFSTVAITASIFGSPIISYFPDYIKAYFQNSTGGLMEVPPVVSLGCSAMATNFDELSELIIKNFSCGLGLETAQRNTFKVDGKNAERVANFVKGVLYVESK